MNKEDDKKIIPDLTRNLFDPDVINAITGNERPNPSVEIFDKITKEIYSKASIKQKTDLSDKQVPVFAKTGVFATKYNMKLLKSLVNEHMILAVSRNRQSRKEYVSIAKSNLGMAQDEESHSIPDRLLGRRR